MNPMKRNGILTALVLILLGVILFVWPAGTLIAVCSIAGWCLLIAGLVVFLTQLFTKNGRSVVILLISGVIAVCGLFIVINPEGLVKIVPILFGLAMLIQGVVQLTRVIQGRDILRNWILLALFSVVSIILGLIIMLYPFETASIMVTLLGFTLIYNGIITLIVSLGL